MRRERHGLSDTHPEAEKRLIEGYRAMTPAQKMRSLSALYHAARRFALVDIRRRHPYADEHETQMRIAARFLEPDLMRRVYGWDPDTEGY